MTQNNPRHYPGDLEQMQSLPQVHGDSHHGKAYLLAADLARVQLGGKS